MSGRVLTDYKPDEVLAAMGTLSESIRYLAHSWGIDTPRDYMQANLDARAILIKLNLRLIDETEDLFEYFDSLKSGDQP